jgi:hypothetical protein
MRRTYINTGQRIILILIKSHFDVVKEVHYSLVKSPVDELG